MNNLVCCEMAMKNMKKHRMQSLLNIFISITVIFLINLYAENMHNVQAQLEKLPEIMPVYGYITNLSGNQKVGLEISEDTVKHIRETDLIKDANYTSRLVAGEGEIAVEQWRQLKLSVLAANNIQAVTGTEISKAEKYNEILKKNKKICIVNKNTAEEKGWDLGEEILVTLYYYQLDDLGEMKVRFLKTCNVQIADTIENISVDVDSVQPDIILPIQAVQAIFRDEGVPYTFDSFNFYVKEPLELNKFKDVMKDLNMKTASQQAASSSVKGTALYLKDESFIAMASQLKEQIQILDVFMPVLFLMLLLLEVVISFLFVQRRKPEILLQRIMGLSGREVKSTFLCEQVMAVFIAGGVCLAVLKAMGYEFENIFFAIVSVILSSTLGSYISLSRGEAAPIIQQISQSS